MKQSDNRHRRPRPRTDILQMPDQTDLDLESTMLYDRLPAAYYQRPDRRVIPPDDW